MNKTPSEKAKNSRFFKPIFITTMFGLIFVVILAGFYASWTFRDIEPGDYSDLKINAVDSSSVDNGWHLS